MRTARRAVGNATGHSGLISGSPGERGRTAPAKNMKTHVLTEQQTSQSERTASSPDGHARREAKPEAGAPGGRKRLTGFDSTQAAELRPTGGAARSASAAVPCVATSSCRPGRGRGRPHFVVITRQRQQPPSRSGSPTSAARSVAHRRAIASAAPVREFLPPPSCPLLRPPRDVFIIARPGAARTGTPMSITSSHAHSASTQRFGNRIRRGAARGPGRHSSLPSARLALARRALSLRVRAASASLSGDPDVSWLKLRGTWYGMRRLGRCHRQPRRIRPRS